MEASVTYQLQAPYAIRRTPGLDYAELLYSGEAVARLTVLPWTGEGELISRGTEAAEMFGAGLRYRQGGGFGNADDP